MNKIVVCYKWVIDEADIKVEESTKSLSFSNASFKVSPYDRNAIEAGMQIAESAGGTCTALSAGTEETKNSRKDVLSRGPEEGYVVIDPQLSQADSYVTANVLEAAIRKIDNVDLVICGEGSADIYAQQVGPRLAQALGWPVITFVTKVEVSEDKVRAHRAVENGIEVIECPMPVVLTILGDSNTPRIPGLKQVMGAGKKPFNVLAADDLGIVPDKLKPLVNKLKTTGNISERKRIIIEGAPAKAAADAIGLLIKEGVIG